MYRGSGFARSETLWAAMGGGSSFPHWAGHPRRIRRSWARPPSLNTASPGLPAIVPLTVRSVLVGRLSKSRNVHPEIDCGADIGVSRRQVPDDPSVFD